MMFFEILFKPQLPLAVGQFQWLFIYFYRAYDTSTLIMYFGNGKHAYKYNLIDKRKILFLSFHIPFEIRKLYKRSCIQKKKLRIILKKTTEFRRVWKREQSIYRKGQWTFIRWRCGKCNVTHNAYTYTTHTP